MTSLKNYIQSYFGIANPNELELVSSLFEYKKIKKGDYILEAGKHCEQLCFIQSGLLRMFVLTDTKEVTQWISSTGYFSADLSSFIFDKPSRWNIHALEDSIIYTISKKNYSKINELIPAWNTFEKLFLTRCFTALEDRVFNHLSLTAEERYRIFFENNKELFNKVPLQYIASMLGMTPETFSRIRKKLNK